MEKKNNNKAAPFALIVGFMLLTNSRSIYSARILEHLSEDIEPLEREAPDDYKHAAALSDLQLLFDTGLKYDIAAWKRPRGNGYTLKDIAKTLRAIQAHSMGVHINMAIVKDKKVIIPEQSRIPQPSMDRVQKFVSNMERQMELGAGIPDTIHIINTWDFPHCKVDSEDELCSSPILSLSKRWDSTTNTSPDRDILMPYWNHAYGFVVDYPWELKKPIALMRAGIQGYMPMNATRIQLYRMVEENPDLKNIMDIGITGNRKFKQGLKVNLTETMPLKDHARYKYLISADGLVAATRLAKLLGMNSVVLKETSPWIEYYNRVTLPGVHFESFNVDNITDVIRELEARPKEDLLKMVQRAQQFQQFYLTDFAKALYMSKIADEVNALFEPGVVQAFIQTVPVTNTTSLDDVIDKLELFTMPDSSSTRINKKKPAAAATGVLSVSARRHQRTRKYQSRSSWLAQIASLLHYGSLE